jgi:UDP-N-acetyl-D-mannosaminuronic acid transferase (WecB/TagA/CpsF family)
MARITIQDVKTMLNVGETYDIVNAINNSASSAFQQYVPLANAENVAAVGAGIQVNQTIQNEFLSNLIDRIGLTVVKRASLQNPLKKFKKGAMPLGRTIEEIFTDIT